AEDGIRDGHVTGVQTCALPIFISCSHSSPGGASLTSVASSGSIKSGSGALVAPFIPSRSNRGFFFRTAPLFTFSATDLFDCHTRSEERRVGKASGHEMSPAHQK